METYATVLTWNGQRFEPMEHDAYRAARGYVAELVTFHGTEAGMTSRRVGPDRWQITGLGDILTVAIERQDA